MGSTPSHPIIDFNGASFGRHNNILLPSETFLPPYPAQRGGYVGNKYVKGYPVPYRWPRNFLVEADRWRGEGKRGRRRRAGGRYVDKGVGGGVGRGMGGVPVVPVPVQVPMYYDARGAKAMSAPNLYGVRGKERQAVQPQVGVRPQMVPTPGVAPAPGQAGGMPYGYGYPPPPAAPRHQINTHLPPSLPNGVHQPQNQNQRHDPAIPDIPYGARVARSTSPARRVPTQNRTQPRVPQGNEWIQGPNPWLDACTCTTNCRCRKGARVLYRAEGREGDRREGEIRYVARDELGRDCGDHDYGRYKEEDGCSDGNGRKGKKKKKERSEKSSEVGKMREEMEGLRMEVEKMRVGRVGGVPMGMDPRFEFGTPPGAMGHHDALNGLENRIGLEPFPMHRPRNPARRSPRPRHRVPDLSDDMDLPTEDHFFPPQPQPHRRPNRRPRPPFNLPPLRPRRNARPPPNYPPINSPLSHRFSAPDEDEEEDWMLASLLGRNPNIAPPPPPPPQRQSPPGRGGPSSLEGRPGERKNQARVEEDSEDV